MKISVIIPTYNRCDSLKLALDSIMLQTYLDIEVIVIVDGCSDETEQLLKKFSIVRPIIFQNNRGAAVGLNEGAKLANGDILLFLDDDMVYDSKLIENHYGLHKTETYDVIIGHFPLGKLPTPSFFRKVIYDWTEGWQLSFGENINFFDVLCSGHFSIRKELFVKIGGFDTEFSQWGRKDSELGHRLIRVGAKFGFCKEAKSYQNYDKLPSKFLSDYKLLGIADVALIRKHPELKKDLLLSSYYQAPWFIRKIRGYAINKNKIFKLFANHLLNIFDVLHNKRIDSEFIEGLFWTIADYKYWEGVVEEFETPKLFFNMIGNSISILLYHRIIEYPSSFSVTLSNFEKQIEFLFKNNYNVVSLENAIDSIIHNKILPTKSVVITFDDGYKDFLEAHKILEKYGFPVSVFIPTKYINSVNNWNTEEMENNIPILSESDIVELRNKNVSFHSHSHSHSILDNLGIEDLENEIVKSKDILKNLGINSNYFSYPSGSYSLTVKKALEKHNFIAGFTCLSTPASSDSDLFEIPRISVDDCSMVSFELLLKYGIGYNFAVKDFYKHVCNFRAVKFWHDIKFDKNSIYVYIKKREYV